MHPAAVGVIEGASVMQTDGSFARRAELCITDGRFSSSPSSSGRRLAATETWVIPGVYDCHSHITWSDFAAGDRARRSPAERTRQTRAAVAATLRSGVVAVRDAGGASAALRDEIASGATFGPRLQVAVDMLGPEVAGDEDRVRSAVDAALERGAQWIKLIATEGITSPSGTDAGSHFTDAEFRIAGERAVAGGARLMVHAWGGRAISSAIDAGAASIEHGIHLTAPQARQAASAGVVFVPTLSIYQDLQALVAAGRLPGVSPRRVAEVVAAHGDAVRIAHEAGVTIAVGSDHGTAEQHGRTLVEIAALIRAGLSSADALLAATANGAALLSVEDGGIIATGALADAVVLTADPTDPATFEDRGVVAAVLLDGELVHVADGTFPHRTQHQRSSTE